MVLTIWKQVTAFAGQDSTVCANTGYHVTDAHATNYTTVAWTITAGTGTLTGANTLAPIYTPGLNEIGNVILTLTAQPIGTCPQATDQVTIHYLIAPTALAGPDGTTCEEVSYPVTGASAPNSTSVLWTTNGTGTLAGATTLTPIYTPAPGEFGQVTLTLTATGASECPVASDFLILSIVPKATANAGPDETICQNTTYTISGATATHYSSLLWTLTGSGTLTDQTTLTPKFTPVFDQTGDVTLTLTVTGNSPCTAVTDAMIIHMLPAAIAYAGLDATICQGSNYPVVGAYVHNSSGIQWTTSGTGTFSNESVINPVYTPSLADISAGSVFLTLHAAGDEPCTTASDEMILYIIPAPTANAGLDGSTCEGIAYTIGSASATHHTSVSWTFTPPTAGGLTGGSTLTPTFTPASGFTGEVTLILTSTGNSPCGPVSDHMILTVVSGPTAYAGLDATICSGSSHTVTGAMAYNYTTILWTTTGTGTLTGATSLTPTYTPATGETAATLTMTVKGFGGACEISDVMTITYVLAPTVNAGPNASICTTAVSYPLNGSTSNNISLLWSTSGTGIFTPNPTTLAATYTPSASDIATGQVQITLTATGSGVCGSVSDMMVLTIWPVATANAGPDETICSGSTFVLTGATATNYASLNWTTSGTGTFITNNSLNPVYTPSAADITTGFVTLTLTSGGLGSCLPVSDPMLLTITTQAVVEAGPGGTICQDKPFTVSGASVDHAVSYVWTAPGPGILTNAVNNLTPTYTPAAGQIGFVTLTLTATGTGTCGTVADQTTIEFKPSAIITTQPEGATLCSGSTHTMTVAATGGASALTYKWQSNNLGCTGASWTDIDGATSSSYITGAMTQTTYYKVIVTQTDFSCDAVTSNCATVTVTQPALANAGTTPVTICNGSAYGLTTATASNYTSVYWITAGDGHFNNANTVNPIYTPGPMDIVNHSVTLTLHALGHSPCPEATSSMILNIQQGPVANAGPDATICETSTYCLCTASASTYTSITWEAIVSLGPPVIHATGTFSDIHAVNPVFTPSASDIAAGCVYLVMHLGAVAPCTEVTDTMKLCISRQPVAYAGADATICEGSSYQILDATATHYTGLIWSTSGTGTFDNTGIINPVYTPGNADILAGFVKLTLHLTACSPCPNDSDFMILTIHRKPNVTAFTISNISCYGFSNGVVSASATGGTSPYAYHWSTGDLTQTVSGLSVGTYTVTVTDDFSCTNTSQTSVTQPSLLTVTGTVVQNIPCNGGNDGMITITASGGTSGYSYLWSNNATSRNISGLTAGTYSVTVTDAHSCTNTGSWTVTQSEGLTLFGSVTHQLFCNGNNDGAIAITAGGGTSPYSYLWSNDATNRNISGLTAGVYTVTVTDNHSCTITGSWMITQPAALTIVSVDTHNLLCNGGSDGSIAITVAGGTTSYHYLWSNNATSPVITGLTAGTYAVTVTDANTCATTGSWTITQPGSLSVTGVVTNITCNGANNGVISVTASGGVSPYAYKWNSGPTTSGITGLSAGTYTVTVSDAHSCASVQQSWTVTQPPAWSIGITGSATVCCNLSAGYTTSVYTATVGGSYLSPLTYQWVVEGGTIVSGQNTSSITVSWACCGNGKVWLTVTDARPCVLTTFIPIVINPVPAPIITGPASVISNQANTQYCTPDYPGHLYTWTVVGGTVTSGSGTHCITVTWGPYPSCGCGSVSVAETFNGCTGTVNYPVSILLGANVTISGYVSYDNSFATKLNGVTVQLHNSSNVVVGTTVTADNPANGQHGYYAFTDTPNGPYTLSGSYDGAWGGNNATDALIVQLNIIGSYPLYGIRDSVADVNASYTITGLDALYIKLRTIGSINSYPAGDWKILDKVFTLSGSPVIEDLTALCTGDVNGSFIPAGFKETSFLSVIEDGIVTVPENEPFVYNIHSSRDADLGAMTLFLGYDQNRYDITGIASATEGMKYSLGEGEISIAWADTKPMKVNSGDLVLSLNMQVKDKISEPSRVFTIKNGSEFADIFASPYDNFDLKMPNVVTPDGSQDISMYNYPNPFANTTTIVYTLPEAGHATLVLTDLYGKTISTLIDQPDKAGSHTVTVDPAALNMMPGVYLYKIIFDSATDTYVKVNKMVFTR
ncbi:MAG: T9SS type A sorting domain-containing protein, partial [Bacteroidota bacterium]